MPERNRDEAMGSMGLTLGGGGRRGGGAGKDARGAGAGPGALSTLEGGLGLGGAELYGGLGVTVQVQDRELAEILPGLLAKHQLGKALSSSHVVKTTLPRPSSSSASRR